MREDILNEIAEFVTSNTQSGNITTSYCRLMRTMLDKKHGPCWHVFVGKNFGAYAVHDKNSFINFKYKGHTFLVYKTTV
jgi:dynein light chain LC8-type